MIAGLQKMTVLDFPGKVACAVFLQGCNFRCPFCHNAALLPHEGEKFMEEAEFFSFLDTRKGLLDGVAITGGEPTGQPGLTDFIRGIKARGFAVKLDTNGTRPDILRQLAEENLLDYVAVDVKNSPEKYAETVGLPRINLEKIEQTLTFLISGTVDYELRTTLVEQLHSAGDMEKIGAWLSGLVPGKKPKQLYLQSFVDRDSVVFSGLSAPSKQQVERYAAILAPHVERIAVRGS